jgi:hypothetical protein
MGHQRRSPWEVGAEGNYQPASQSLLQARRRTQPGLPGADVWVQVWASRGMLPGARHAAMRPVHGCICLAASSKRPLTSHEGGTKQIKISGRFRGRK